MHEKWMWRQCLKWFQVKSLSELWEKASDSLKTWCEWKATNRKHWRNDFKNKRQVIHRSPKLYRSTLRSALWAFVYKYCKYQELSVHRTVQAFVCLFTLKSQENILTATLSSGTWQLHDSSRSFRTTEVLNVDFFGYFRYVSFLSVTKAVIKPQDEHHLS